MEVRIPSTIHIGLESKKGETFDDSIILTKEGGFLKINAIKVYYNEKYVLGMSIYYKLIDGQYLKATHNPQKDKKSIQKRVFEIGPDDYLKEISGHVTEKGITRLNFSSYRGKEGSYGSDQGQPFIFKYEGQTFGAFKGGFKDHLLFLDVPVYPCPIEFLQSLSQLQVNLNIINPNNHQQALTQPNQQNANQHQINSKNQNNNIQNGGQILFSEPINQSQNNQVIKGVYIPPSNQFGQVYVPVQVQNPFYNPNGNQPVFQPISYNQQPQSFPVNNNNFDNQSVQSNSSNQVMKSKYPTFK